MSALFVLPALAAIWLLGACSLSLLDARAHGASGVVADYVTGVVFLGFVGMTGIAVGAGVSLAAVYAMLMIAVAACAVTGAWRRLPRPSGASFRLPLEDPVAAVILLTAVLMTAVILTGAMQDRLWWDGWSIWAFKARVLFEEGTLPSSFLDPEGIYVTANLDYPLAVPLLDWWLYRHVGEASPALASFAGAVWYTLLPALAWSSLRPVAGARIAGLAALGLAAFWPASFYAAGGTADVVVAVALLGTVIEIIGAVETRERAPLVRAAAYLTLAALSKNEGLALAIIGIVVAGGALALRGERRPGRLLWLALPLVLLAPWLAFTRSNAIGSAAVGGMVAAGGEGAASAADRLPMFVTGLRLLASSMPWMPVSLLVILGIWVLVRSRRPELATGWALLALYLAALSLVYLRSPEDMLWLLTTSAPRVFGALVPALVYVSLIGVVRRSAPEPTASRQEAGDAVLV